MKVQNTYRGRTYKEVTIENVPEGTPDDILVGYAMRVTDESPSSLFGWHVTYVPMTTTAVVTLNTD